ncbi:MAG TPA: quinolinate synthase NadA [Spirochaetota bacterium]|nr:quinolinate synthase NadA [Spirochaetota bacterium]HPI90921.1 quinolinate synthase NadA [Spirochaetota bacterium]HPR48393.1 quinolinate synthase NadA [Spirochaetota bacterium]
MDLVQKIKTVAKEKNALILAHNYQNPEIQDIADRTGDSLELARIATRNDADIIVFCGVHFMAESAAILNPEKKVLLPDISAGCPMADMARPEQVLAMKQKHPGAAVVSYINSSAAVKAVSDVICTSANAVKIVQKIDADTIIFVPDRNLGSYVQRFTDKKIILWNGYCPTHENFTPEQLELVKEKNPGAFVMVHPECRPAIIDMADAVMSTGEMVTFVKNTDRKKIIVGTEIGMIHKLKTVAPDLDYIPASDSFICADMKKITLQKLHDSLEHGKDVVTVDPRTSDRARKALEKMLELS